MPAIERSLQGYQKTGTLQNRTQFKELSEQDVPFFLLTENLYITYLSCYVFNIFSCTDDFLSVVVIFYSVVVKNTTLLVR